MDTFKHQLFDDDRLFEICQDIDGDNELYSLFDVHLNNNHYEYLYRDNASGQYTSTPQSRFTHLEITELGKRIEEELQKQQANPQ